MIDFQNVHGFRDCIYIRNLYYHLLHKFEMLHWLCGRIYGNLQMFCLGFQLLYSWKFLQTVVILMHYSMPLKLWLMIIELEKTVVNFPFCHFWTANSSFHKLCRYGWQHKSMGKRVPATFGWDLMFRLKVKKSC